MKAGKQFSIWLTGDTQRILDDRTSAHEGEGSRSGLLQKLVARYDEIVRASVPQLSESEWMLCADALNGIWLNSDRRLNAYIWAEVADAIRLNRLDEKWSAEDGDDLVRRLRACTVAERMALIDVIERLWSDPQADFGAKLREWKILA